MFIINILISKLCWHALRGHQGPLEERGLRAWHEDPAGQVHQHVERGAHRRRVALRAVQLGRASSRHEQGQEDRGGGGARRQLNQGRPRQDQVPVRRALLLARPGGVHSRILPAQPRMATHRAAHHARGVRIVAVRSLALLSLPLGLFESTSGRDIHKLARSLRHQAPHAGRFEVAAGVSLSFEAGQPRGQRDQRCQTRTLRSAHDSGRSGLVQRARASSGRLLYRDLRQPGRARVESVRTDVQAQVCLQV